MSARTAPAPAPRRRLGPDFWKFWTGQTISNLGSSFSGFALPLLIYSLTKSPINLGLATAAYLLPYLFFGLVIGAWVDRVDRRRLMIGTDVARAAVTAVIPLLAMFGAGGDLLIWSIYVVAFVSSTLTIFFNSAEFAAIPSLVPSDDLVSANGQIQASYSAANVLGPLLAGVLVAFMPLTDLLWIDAASFLLSTFSLLLIRTPFNAENTKKPATSIRQDIVEGLRYVLSHPVLRMISLMMALVNFVATTINSQLVLFAKDRYNAGDTEISVLFSAGSVGIIVLSLAAGPLRKRWSFSQVALTALALEGLLTLVMAVTPWYWVTVVLWAVGSGLGILFNINTGSLRQTIVPNHLLGRVMSIAAVLAWSAIPVGAFLGGVAIQATGDVVLVYAVIGVVTFLLPVAFAFTPLGHAEEYLPKPEAEPTETPVEAAHGPLPGTTLPAPELPETAS